MGYQIEITPTALEDIEAITERRTRGAIIRRIDTLSEEPKKLGKPLRGWLTGFLSTRAAGQRYRIVYKIDLDKQRVLIYNVGIRREGNRRDLYSSAENCLALVGSMDMETPAGSPNFEEIEAESWREMGKPP